MESLNQIDLCLREQYAHFYKNALINFHLKEDI